MDETEFWELVDDAREAAEGDPEEQADLLVDRLAQLDPDSVLDFARHFESRYNRAYRWDLWGAAWVLLDGASDDAFDFFRCWLIGQGREVFEGAVHDPDSLAELLDEFDEEIDGDGEELGYAADEAYEQLTGVVAPDLAIAPAPAEPEGTSARLRERAAPRGALSPAVGALQGLTRARYRRRARRRRRTHQRDDGREARQAGSASGVDARFCQAPGVGDRVVQRGRVGLAEGGRGDRCRAQDDGRDRAEHRPGAARCHRPRTRLSGAPACLGAFVRLPFMIPTSSRLPVGTTVGDRDLRRPRVRCGLRCGSAGRPWSRAASCRISGRRACRAAPGQLVM